MGWSIAIDNFGNVNIAYQTGALLNQTNHGSDNIVVFKLNESGNTIWAEQLYNFNTSGDDQNPSITIDPYGNICSLSN